MLEIKQKKKDISIGLARFYHNICNFIEFLMYVALSLSFSHATNES